MLIPRIPVSWCAVAALGAALTLAGWALKHSYAEQGALKTQIAALNGALLRAAEQRATDQATLDRLAKKNAATAREMARAQASLQRSLSANREWADQPVPKEVQDALRKP